MRDSEGGGLGFHLGCQTVKEVSFPWVSSSRDSGRDSRNYSKINDLFARYIVEQLELVAS